MTKPAAAPGNSWVALTNPETQGEPANPLTALQGIGRGETGHLAWYNHKLALYVAGSGAVSFEQAFGLSREKRRSAHTVDYLERRDRLIAQIARLLPEETLTAKARHIAAIVCGESAATGMASDQVRALLRYKGLPRTWRHYFEILKAAGGREVD